MNAFLSVILPATVLLAGCAKSPALRTVEEEMRPTIAEIASSYTSYVKMTEKAVFVNPELAMLCIGANQAQVEAARHSKGPHAHSAILVYMNDPAADAFTSKATKFPVGSVVIKKKALFGHRDESRKWIGHAENGIGGMVKRPPGYDQSNGDWEYLYFDDPAKVESGRMESCIRCHQSAKSSDCTLRVFAGSRANHAKGEAMKRKPNQSLQRNAGNRPFCVSALSSAWLI